MIPARAIPGISRILTVESFGKRFTHLEWKYLSSYRWFLRDLAKAVENDEFMSLQIEAENALVRANLRRAPKNSEDELSVCHSADWYE